MQKETIEKEEAVQKKVVSDKIQAENELARLDIEATKAQEAADERARKSAAEQAMTNVDLDKAAKAEAEKEAKELQKQAGIDKELIKQKEEKAKQEKALKDSMTDEDWTANMPHHVVNNGGYSYVGLNNLEVLGESQSSSSSSSSSE